MVLLGIALVVVGAVLLRSGRLNRRGVLALSLAVSCAVLGLPGWHSPAAAADCPTSSAPVAQPTPSEQLPDAPPIAPTPSESLAVAPTPTPTPSESPTPSATPTVSDSPSATPTPTPTVVLPAVACPPNGDLTMLLEGESIAWTPYTLPDPRGDAGAFAYEYVQIPLGPTFYSGYSWHVVRAADGAVSADCGEQYVPNRAGICVGYDELIYAAYWYWLPDELNDQGLTSDYVVPGEGQWIDANYTIYSNGCGGGGGNN